MTLQCRGSGRTCQGIAERSNILVVIRMTWRGTQTGEFMGMPPTGKSISVGVIDIFRIAGERSWNIGA